MACTYADRLRLTRIARNRSISGILQFSQTT